MIQVLIYTNPIWIIIISGTTFNNACRHLKSVFYLIVLAQIYMFTHDQSLWMHLQEIPGFKMQSWQVRVQGWCGQGWNTGGFLRSNSRFLFLLKDCRRFRLIRQESVKKIVYSFYISVENLSEIFIYL